MVSDHGRRSPGSARGDSASSSTPVCAADVPVVFAGRRGAYELRARLFTGRLYSRLLAHVAGVPVDAAIVMALDRTVVERLLAMQGRRLPSLVAMVGCIRVAMISIPVERAPPGRREPSSYGRLGRVRLGFRAMAWALAGRLRGAR